MKKLKSSASKTSVSRNRSANKRLAYEGLEHRNLLATFVVNSIIDDVSGVPDGNLTLREAVIAAETNAAFGDAAAGDLDGDRIEFDSSLADQTIVLSNGEFAISDDLRIFGGDRNVTINAGGLDRAFSIDSTEQVVLRGFNITGGMTVGEGGAISITGAGSTTLNELNFTANVAMGAGGGAIVSTANSVAILNSTFDQNIASGASGSGGALLVNSGDVAITNANFMANVANRAGGAIEIVDGSISINESTLGGDTLADGNIAGPAGTAAPGNGGALHVTGSMNTSVVVLNSSVLNNVAASEGGGLWNQSGSSMLVKDSTVSNNIAMGADADTGGGGIFNNGGTTRVRGSVVEGNIANGTSGSGGGFLSTDGLLSIIDTTIISNIANRAGGGIEIIDGDLYVGASTLNSNIAGVLDGSANPGNGGALHVSGTDGTNSSFVDSTIAGNFAAREGGGLWNQSGSSLFVRGSSIVNNEAGGDSADDGGGGIFNNGGTTRVRATDISGNIASGTSGSGGGVFSTDGIFYANESTISANSANRAGGGIEVIDGRVVLLDTMLGGTAEADGNIAGPAGTAAPGNGGGLHVSGASETLTIINGGTVANNVAASEGGGLWNQSGSTMTVDGGTVIEDNVALGAGADNGGGGLFNNGGRLSIKDATIVNNSATGASGSGGGIFSTDGLVTVEDSTISANIANRAGGGVELIDGTFLMFDSILGGAGSGNVAGPEGTAAPGNGGGLHVSGMSGTYVGIDGSIVNDNVAGNEGGGLWIQSGSTLAVRNGTTVGYNTAGLGGGGGLFSNGGTLNVMGSTVVNNNTTGNGGGVKAIAGSTTRIDSTAVGYNSALSGGGFANDSMATVRDSFFANNEATVEGGGIFTDVNGDLDIATTGFFGNTPNDQN
ncbi:beta strand repeat-containing protein [Mariniblastus fucicola]|nr:hypothetical protein [Mariniblastus fucicola]